MHCVRTQRAPCRNNEEEKAQEKGQEREGERKKEMIN